MIISPYLSKMLQENPEKEIKITLLNNGEDLFIGFLDENNKYPIPIPYQEFYSQKKENIMKALLSMVKEKDKGKLFIKMAQYMKEL